MPALTERTTFSFSVSILNHEHGLIADSAEDEPSSHLQEVEELA
jgi:hypothetical protein